MKKIFCKVLVITLICALFSSCGSKTLVDDLNYNFDPDGVAFVDEDGNEIKKVEYTNKDKSVEFYINSSKRMDDVAKDPNFKKLIMDTYDAVQQTWSDVSTKIYNIDGNIQEVDISYINNIRMQY